MVPLASLWMPIAASAILVFLVSSVLHMALKYHKADYRSLPDEERQVEALRGLAPGLYVFPYCSDTKEMGSPPMIERYQKGPCGLMAIQPSGPPPMGKLLGLWFVYTLVVSFFTAYIASHTLPGGADYLAVFRVVGAISFMAYGVANLVGSIWQGIPWSNSFRALFDGLVYSLFTAGAFGWLWPAG